MAEHIVVAGLIAEAVDALVGFGDWCLVRRTDDGQFCGPLSMMKTDPGARFALGFPHGYVGLLKLFATADEALAYAEPPAGKWRDRPASLEDLHFSVAEVSRFTGQATVVYDGGDYRRALVAWLVKSGIFSLDLEPPAFVHIECRPVR